MNKRNIIVLILSLVLVTLIVWAGEHSLGKGNSLSVAIANDTTVRGLTLLDGTLAANNYTNGSFWSVINASNGGVQFLNMTNTTNTTDVYYNFLVNYQLFTEDTYYNLTLNATNETTTTWEQWNSDNTTKAMGSIYINNFPYPNLSYGDVVITEPSNFSNISGRSVDFKATINANTTTNMSWFLVNSTAATLIATLNGTNLTNTTINTELYADGPYNVTINVTSQDTAYPYFEVYTPLMPATEKTRYGSFAFIIDNITIDNTDPSISTISVSDGDGTVYTRGSQTVTCSGVVDNTLGTGVASYKVELVKPNGDVVEKGGVTSYEFKNTDTASTGSYTARCSVTDFAGNTVTKEEPFNVRVRSSSAPSATGVPSADYSFVGRDSVVASGREGTSKTFTFDGTTTHTIEFMTVTDTSATLKISSTPQELTLSIGGSQDIDVNADGKTDITVTLTNIQNGRASIMLDKLAGAVDVSEPSIEEVEEAERIAEEERIAAEEAERAREAAAGTTTLIVIIVIIIVIVGGYFLWKKGGKKGKGKKGHVRFSRAELRQK